MGLDNQYHTMGGADFHIAMTDMLLAGFPVAGNTGRRLPGAARGPGRLRRCPPSVSAGNGYTRPGRGAGQALDCLVEGTELRRLHPAQRHQPGPPRPDDLVDQLGPVLRLGVPPEPRPVPAGAALSRCRRPGHPARAAARPPTPAVACRPQSGCAGGRPGPRCPRGATGRAGRPTQVPGGTSRASGPDRRAAPGRALRHRGRGGGVRSIGDLAPGTDARTVVLVEGAERPGSPWRPSPRAAAGTSAPRAYGWWPWAARRTSATSWTSSGPAGRGLRLAGPLRRGRGGLLPARAGTLRLRRRPVPGRPDGPRVPRLRGRPGGRTDPGGRRRRGAGGARRRGRAALVRPVPAAAGAAGSGRRGAVCAGSSAPGPAARARTRGCWCRRWSRTGCPAHSTRCSPASDRKPRHSGASTDHTSMSIRPAGPG